MAALVGRFFGLVVGAYVVLATAAGGATNRLMLETSDDLLLESGDGLELEN